MGDGGGSDYAVVMMTTFVLLPWPPVCNLRYLNALIGSMHVFTIARYKCCGSAGPSWPTDAVLQ